MVMNRSDDDEYARTVRTDVLKRLQALAQADGVEMGDSSSTGPCCGIDPSDRRFLLQVLPDGTRTRGRFVNRRFVACSPRTGRDNG